MSNLPISDKIKALSFKQPIAWLIAHGYLLVDDRSWGTSYQGSILIHASKGLYKDYYEYLITQTDVPIPSREHLEYGGVVGLAKLILCSKPESLPEHIRGEERAQFSGVPRGHYGFFVCRCHALTLDTLRRQTGHLRAGCQPTTGHASRRTNRAFLTP